MYSKVNNELRYNFQKKVNFIDDYFSREVRKFKFETDGTFNMISIELNEFINLTQYETTNEVFRVKLPFKLSELENAINCNDLDFYINKLEEGFISASKYKNIPIIELLDLIKRFKKNNYKNEWLHTKKEFKNENVKIELRCEFTTFYFQLKLLIFQNKSGLKVLDGVLMRVEPGISIHLGLYKDIFIEKNHIVITDKTDSPIIKIQKNEALSGKLKFKIIGDDFTKNLLSYEINRNFEQTD